MFYNYIVVFVFVFFQSISAAKFAGSERRRWVPPGSLARSLNVHILLLIVGREAKSCGLHAMEPEARVAELTVQHCK